MSDRRITVFRLVDHMGLGGVQNSVVSYLRHCDRARYRVVVGALQKKEPWAAWRDAPEIAAARLVRVRHARDTAGIRALANVLRDEKIDILHCHSYYPNTVGRQAALLAGTPVVLAHFHNTYEHRRDARMAAWETVLWPFTSRGLMVSERAREFWADLTRCSTQAAPAPPTNERTTIVNVPIDGENLRAGLDRPTPELERALAECHPDWPMICSVGRLHAHKR
ncbi:MAG: glycosyltransferase, partial [Candidatus Sumerlaeota bacterium]|nr:glycosyltransferase [Candidatus Sumerlaeota bacterium]